MDSEHVQIMNKQSEELT